MENTGNLKMKNLNPLNELLSPYYTHSLKTVFPIDKLHYCLTRFCRKTFEMASLMRNEQ